MVFNLTDSLTICALLNTGDESFSSVVDGNGKYSWMIGPSVVMGGRSWLI